MFVVWRRKFLANVANLKNVIMCFPIYNKKSSKVYLRKTKPNKISDDDYTQSRKDKKKSLQVF